MATPYEIAFKYEILNEFIAHVDGMIGREFPKKLPADIAPLEEEVWDIYHKLPLEDDMEVLDRYDKRLIEIRDYIQSRAEQSQKNEKGVDKSGCAFAKR